MDRTPEALLILSIVDADIATFSHTNIRLRLGPLHDLIVGPKMHRWHHVKSAEHQRSNFGNIPSIFDWIFGTARLHSGKFPDGFSIDDADVSRVQHSEAVRLRVPVEREADRHRRDQRLSRRRANAGRKLQEQGSKAYV